MATDESAFTSAPSPVYGERDVVVRFRVLDLLWKPLRRGSGDQYLHRTSDQYRAAIRRELCAYHVHVQLGCIAQGLLQCLSINHTAEVWRCFRSWLRTMNPAMPPSELIVANALRWTLPAFLAVPAFTPDLTKIRVMRFLNVRRNGKKPQLTIQVASFIEWPTSLD